MKRDVYADQPTRHYFVEALHDSIGRDRGLRNTDAVEAYVRELLADFVDIDGGPEVRDSLESPFDSETEVFLEGDLTRFAESFDLEREVLPLAGDFLLRWSGLFPEFLKQMKAPGCREVLLDPVQQGPTSYYVVSTFRQGSYAHEAPIFEKLSDEFEQYRYGLSLVRASFEGFARQGWTDGFKA